MKTFEKLNSKLKVMIVLPTILACIFGLACLLFGIKDKPTISEKDKPEKEVNTVSTNIIPHIKIIEIDSGRITFDSSSNKLPKDSGYFFTNATLRTKVEDSIIEYVGGIDKYKTSAYLFGRDQKKYPNGFVIHIAKLENNNIVGSKEFLFNLKGAFSKSNLKDSANILFKARNNSLGKLTQPLLVCDDCWPKEK